MAYGRCAHCNDLAYLNSNNLCEKCATHPGIFNPAPKYGICKNCGQPKSDLNSDGVCASCNSGKKSGLFW